MDDQEMAERLNAIAEKVDLCGQCNHAFDPHAMVATTGDPMKGGIMLCPIKGCDCYSTWAPEGHKDEMVIPDRFEVEKIREYIQSK